MEHGVSPGHIPPYKPAQDPGRSHEYECIKYADSASIVQALLQIKPYLNGTSASSAQVQERMLAHHTHSGFYGEVVYALES